MPRTKKLASAAGDTAKTRLAGLTAIGPKVDLGKNLTVAAFQAESDKLAVDIAEYNAMLSDLDAKLNTIHKREKSLKAMSSHVLRRISADFGLDSDEYEKVGGTRTSERKKPVRKPKATL